MDIMKEAGEPLMSRELAAIITEREGRRVTAEKVGMHMKVLVEDGSVRRKVVGNKFSIYWMP